MSVFNTIGNLRPKRYFYDLSFDHKFDCDMGQLIPLFGEECYPGDKFKLSNEIVIRFNPLNAPVLHEINVFTEYWFIPTRLIFDNWIDFISGGDDGTDSHTLPLWNDYLTTAAAKYSLWDYFGFPLVAMQSNDNCPIDFLRRCYNLVFNEFYRDENIDNEISLTNNSVQYRRWKKDYFTSALPFRQRGLTPTLPLYGDASVYISSDSLASPLISSPYSNDFRILDTTDLKSYVFSASDSSGSYPRTNRNLGVRTGSNTASAIKADLSSVSAGDISDLRLAFQLQKFMERNARAGVRYPEFCISHFGVAPSDSTLQRPEYLGGSKSPLVVSEVLQTSEDGTTPQGHLAGRGIGVSANYISSYTCPEHGYIIGLFSIMPRLGYSSQGVNKKWLRRSRYDFYFPEFAHLSEQPVKTRELYVSGNLTNDDATFGYQPIYQELRHNQNMISGAMRDTLNFWHLNRDFNSSPVLNSSFLQCQPSKRIFSVPSEPGFVVDVGNIIKAVRPLTKHTEPGFLDHF